MAVEREDEEDAEANDHMRKHKIYGIAGMSQARAANRSPGS